VNAAEQAITIEFTSKIAAVVNLFKAQCPDLRADLKPWSNDQDTQEWIDPDSIDLGFHFPGVSRLFRCRSLLVQIRFYRDPLTEVQRTIGVEIAGFDHRGQQWRFSTIDAWSFSGASCPLPEAEEKLKTCCRQVFDLFNGPR
jgi:hypothetical protein